MAKITVVNKHHGVSGVYIGRGSPLGNPFPINNVAGMTRSVVIDLYKDWLLKKITNNDPAVCKALNQIAGLAQQPEGVALQCFCKPHPCHGDVIREIVLNAIENQRS